MGGVLSHGETNQKSPRFVVAASADPGTPDEPGQLLRLQIIKGWVGEDGSFHHNAILQAMPKPRIS